jgi:hypothetical protein
VSELGTAYLRLIARRIPLLAQQKRIAFLKEQIDIYAKEGGRIFELMKQHHISGDNDSRKWDILLNNCDLELEEFNAASKKHNDLTYSLYLEQLRLMEECIEETTKLSPLIVPVLTEIRKEIEMPLDETSLAELIEESIEHQKSAVAVFIEQAKSSVAKPAP